MIECGSDEFEFGLSPLGFIHCRGPDGMSVEMVSTLLLDTFRALVAVGLRFRAVSNRLPSDFTVEVSVPG